MSEPENKLVPPALSSAPKKKKGWLIVSGIAVFILFATFPFLSFLKQINSNQALSDAQQAQQQHLIEAIMLLKQHDDRLGKIEDRLNKLEAAPAAATNSADVEALQKDVAALSASLTSLQNQHQQNAVGQGTLAGTIAFIELRDAALSGRGFTDELTALENLSANDHEVMEQLRKLEPHAHQGEATAAALSDGFSILAPQARLAIDKAAAQGWWQQVLVELQSLVSIRPLHGSGATALFKTIEDDLARNDLAAALNDTKKLPPEALSVLNEWQGQVEARQSVNEILHSLSGHFINTQAKP